MEIIREATYSEAIKLEGLSQITVSQLIFCGAIIVMIVAIIVGMIIEGFTWRMWHVCLSLGVGILISVPMVILATYVESIEQDQYEHDYYLALIDDSTNFDSDQFELLEHHADNTYFVEEVINQ